MADPNAIVQTLLSHGAQIPPQQSQLPQQYPAPNPHPVHIPKPDMHTPQPLPFSGDPNDLPRFKLKLTHYFWGHQMNIGRVKVHELIKTLERVTLKCLSSKH